MKAFQFQGFIARVKVRGRPRVSPFPSLSAMASVSLANFRFFPPFVMLPQADELDANYYAENVQGACTSSAAGQNCPHRLHDIVQACYCPLGRGASLPRLLAMRCPRRRSWGTGKAACMAYVLGSSTSVDEPCHSPPSFSLPQGRGTGPQRRYPQRTILPRTRRWAV